MCLCLCVRVTCQKSNKQIIHSSMQRQRQRRYMQIKRTTTTKRDNNNKKWINRQKSQKCAHNNKNIRTIYVKERRNEQQRQQSKSSAASHSFKTTRRLRFTCQIVSLKESESKSRRERARERDKESGRCGHVSMHKRFSVHCLADWLLACPTSVQNSSDSDSASSSSSSSCTVFFCCLCVPHLRNGRDCRVPLSAACMFFCNGGAPKHQTIVRCPPLPYSFSSTAPTSACTHTYKVLAQA